jgi:predicted benzoate:H+ symporter BenE
MTDPTTGGWAPCPPGELERLASWLAFRRRLRTAAVVAAVVLGTASVAVGGAWGIHAALSPSPTPSEPTPCWDEQCPPAPAEK